jgi:hypothetical protein
MDKKENKNKNIINEITNKLQEVHLLASRSKDDSNNMAILLIDDLINSYKLLIVLLSRLYPDDLDNEKAELREKINHYIILKQNITK